jgi:hypothetical protein
MADAAQRIVAIALTGGLILFILELVRRKALMERYAILWLFSAFVLLLLAAWKGLLSTVAFKVGIHYPPSLLFAVAFGVELLLLLHFTLAISSLTDQNKILAQRVSILQHRLEQVEEHLDATGAADRTEPGSGRTAASELTRTG